MQAMAQAKPAARAQTTLLVVRALVALQILVELVVAAVASL
jgi:hypothetical protein